jgi:hypothetical protein
MSDLATDHLWALDLDGDRCPFLAHLIIKSEHGPYGEARTSACGRTFTRGTHPHGWWRTRPGELPFDQARDIHCGSDLLAGSAPGPEEALAIDSDQHAICLDGAAPALTHPASCPDPAGCPFTAAAGSLSVPVLATGGTWTCDLSDGALILLKRIAAPA